MRVSVIVSRLAWCPRVYRLLVLGQRLLAGGRLFVVVAVVLNGVHEEQVVAGLDSHHLGNGLAHKRRPGTERLEAEEEERAHQVLAVLARLAHVQHQLGALQPLLGELEHRHEAVLGRLGQDHARQLDVQRVVVEHLRREMITSYYNGAIAIFKTKMWSPYGDY